ncbi:TonB-linked SusC/RagA family outer membrane protein [Gillisia mitskevichiae]|uniref:TonB-linked SusC/RagA family outer membrane protein n=1 Tax=Gillisia mitskevichiae TaxID=270921 RepID=A0A495PXX6_9FLAO|nr:TonB-dependent receptor [Gillisia mitskevichiae]RKS55049.1 TonB-linked SusC/RagA family outer membrane protein [Gillisia mitskevichiae]
MEKRLNGILTLFLAFVVQLTFAQDLTVTGTVTDAEGLPLPSVNVLVQGTNTGALTDFDGKYSIKAATGSKLVFSYVGFLKQTVTVGTQSVVNVSMQEDASQLDEVIVLGYSTKGVEEVTGSSVQLSGAELAESPTVSVDQALQGRVAGLQMSQASGTPGSVADIRIRGISSINADNDPLYVIDGVPVANTNVSGSDNYSSLNPLASINSQDIETLTVLKDASATAAYGARGSNGVITTKSGKAGDTKFTFSSQVGFQNDAFNKRDVLTGAERYTLLNEALYRSYGPNGTIADLGISAPGNGISELLSVDDFYDGVTDNDWAGEIRNEDALTQNYTFSASGGGEKSNFYASLGYNKTEATVIGSAFERINGSLSFDRDLRDNLKLSTSMNVSNITQNPVLENGTFFSNPFITRYLMNPFNSIRNDDGSYNIDLPFGSLPNIFYVNENNVTRNALTRALSNTKLDWELYDGLTFSNRVSIDYQLNEYTSYRNRYEGDADDINGDIAISDQKNFNLVYQSSLNYGFKLGENHNFDITTLFEYQKNQNTYLFGSGENFPVDGLIQINTASANFDADSQFEDWYNVSYLGLVNYNYAGKYVLDGTIRREGSSRFSPGNRFGTFGSVGAAWNVHREDFMAGNIFNTLRLRGSYGITGNNGVGLNAYQPLLTYSANYADNGAGFPSQFGNAGLTWEKGESFDIGLTFGLLQNRISGSFAYYNRRTYDLLLNVPLSLTTGFDEQARNVGEMVNKGIEAELGIDIIQTEDFTWNISANYATVDNEVTELALGANGSELDTEAGSSYKTTRTGLPLRSWYMRTWSGVNADTGAPEWFLNGVDGEVTSNYNAAARVDQGASALPTYSGGLGMRLDYKGFFAEGNASFAGGHKIYEQYAQFYLRTNSFTLNSYNGVSELLDRWQQPGDVTNVPKLDYGRNDNFHATSSRHLYDGDYVRLKNVAIGYSLPSKFVESVGIDGLTLTLRGTNVATWVKDDGLLLDPEVRANGYTALTTPPVESYTLGVNIKF